MPGLKIFRIITFVLPFLALGYVMWRSWRIMPFPAGAKTVVLAMMFVLFALMPVCMFPGTLDKLPLPLGAFLYKASLSWVFVLIYLLLAFVMTDLLGVLRIMPLSLRVSSMAGTAIVAGVVAAFMLAGNLNYHHKHREKISITSPKAPARPLKIVMMSDIHLGYHIRRNEFSKWVDMINGEKPDMVLIAGDIIDRSVAPLLADDDAKEFRRISAPVFACPGNHEYYSGIDNSKEFYKLAGITMLRDTAVCFEGINIIGRDDRTNLRRKPLQALVSETDGNKFTILLDHQPYSLEEAEKCGIDFEFCGHTPRASMACFTDNRRYLRRRIRSARKRENEILRKLRHWNMGRKIPHRYTLGVHSGRSIPRPRFVSASTPFCGKNNRVTPTNISPNRSKNRLIFAVFQDIVFQAFGKAKNTSHIF